MVPLPNVETVTLELGFIAALLSVAGKLDLVKSIDMATEKRAQAVRVGEHLLLLQQIGVFARLKSTIKRVV